jgi:hypothetical protein
MRRGTRHLIDFSDLSFLVLDEADRMVQQVCGEVWEGSGGDHCSNKADWQNMARIGRCMCFGLSSPP